jgi:CRISPR-associated endoribonuclease Cas6
MPYSVVIKLHPQKKCTIPVTPGRQAHGLFFNLIKTVSPFLAEELHREPSPKSYTISPVQGKFKTRDGQSEIFPDEEYWMRITLLRQDTYKALMDYFIKKDSYLNLAGENFNVSQLITSPGTHSWSNYCDYKDLKQNTSQSKEINFRFFSPTTFKTGDITLPLPIPRLIFSGILKKWNRYASDLSISEDILHIIENSVAISKHDIQTRALDFEKYALSGFTGECTLKITGKISRSDIEIINLLSDFAFYSCAGIKSTMGMGQIKRI